MTNTIKPAAAVRRLALVFGVLCALAAPAAAADGHKLAGYKARGLVVATGPTTITVCVGTSKKSVNKRAAAWRGGPVVFDVRSAKLKVRDIDRDHVKDLGDVQVGDRVTVGARLPSDLSLAVSPFAAKAVKVTYKAKIKPKEGFFGGVCPEWNDGPIQPVVGTT